MKKRLMRVGASVGVLIPSSYLKTLKLASGSDVDIYLRGQEIVLRSPSWRGEKTLGEATIEELREELERRESRPIEG